MRVNVLLARGHHGQPLAAPSFLSDCNGAKSLQTQGSRAGAPANAAVQESRPRAPEENVPKGPQDVMAVNGMKEALSSQQG